MIKDTFTVLFIDEDKSERYKFQEYAENFEDINVEVIAPPEKIGEIIQRIMEGDIDAVISDFDLKDKGDSATYFGDEVIEVVLENKPDFPVFIFTSVEPQALEHSQSVHYVYDKKLMNDKEKTFLSKVLKEIKNYYERIEKWKNDFAKLKLKKIRNKISVKEEEYLIELDSLLEKSINQKTSIANQIKSDQKETLEVLIKKTDKILEQVKSNLNKE